MIQAKELRIGNLAKDIHNNIIVIDELKKLKGNDGYSYLINGLLQEHLFPINITEEILFNFRFELSTTTNLLGFDCNGYRYCVDLKNNCLHFDYKSYESLFINIKYLHELQNLYFALTGKELEINL